MRVQIQFPEFVHFECTFQLRANDMNYGAHLGNDRILVLAHEARVQYFKSLGVSEFDFFGTSVIQADAAIVYKSEGYTGDEILCKLAIAGISRAGFEVYCEFINLTTEKLLAICKTGLVCYNYSEKKVNSVPEGFVNLFN